MLIVSCSFFEKIAVVDAAVPGVSLWTTWGSYF